jgi:hypothetical protein
LQLWDCFRDTHKHKLFLIKQSPAASFYSLPMIAECSVVRSLQFVTPTFTVIFSLCHKKPRVEMGAVLIAI